MKRIDTINARENMFGVGKSGFHDNADLPGQDATYVSPEWFNTVQEELCNLLELRGITLDPASKRQLYDLLTTQADLEALADEIETNFIRKSQIVDNLTTNDADKVASAKQVTILQDNKLDKTDLKDASTAQKGIVQLNNTLTSTSTNEALTAAQGKVLKDLLFGIGQTLVDVTSSIVIGTTYTNTTPRPISFYVSIRDGTGEQYATVNLEGKAIIDNLSFDGGTSWGSFFFSFTVNPGKTYMINRVGSSVLKIWMNS